MNTSRKVRKSYTHRGEREANQLAGIVVGIAVLAFLAGVFVGSL